MEQVELMEQSRSKHILALSKELLDDIELARVSPDNLLLKTTRLARWVGSEEIKYWLKCEMLGYNSTSELSLKYMSKTGRWTDKDNKKGYYGTLSQIHSVIETEKVKMALLRIPDSSGENSHISTARVAYELTECSKNITRFSGIRSKVLANLHSFVSEVYYEKQFDTLTESIFELYKKDVDLLLSETCGSVLEQVPSVMDRLSDGREESISQALNTCRRIIDSFADSIYPARNEPVSRDGKDIDLGPNRPLNRINEFVYERVESKSRKEKIRQNLKNLYDRVCTGVHKEVSSEEARALFLNTYLFLGEILHIEKKQ